MARLDVVDERLLHADAEGREQEAAFEPLPVHHLDARLRMPVRRADRLELAERGADVVAGALAAEVLVEASRPRDRVEQRVRDEAVDLARDDEALLAVDLGPLHRALAEAGLDVAREGVGSLVVVVVGVEGQKTEIGHRASPPERGGRVLPNGTCSRLPASPGGVPEGDHMVLERFRVDGKVAIVTGAGRGIGAATAVALAEAGADVLLAARTQEQLEAVAAKVRAHGQRALVVPTDVDDEERLAGLADRAVAELGRLDIVVNNAGGTAPRPFLATSAGYLQRSFHFNVVTAFVLSKAAVPHMLEQGGGSIVNISSAIGRLRDRGFVAYGTAKAALSHMTRLMAADLSPNIRVNGIAVGSVATSALETVLTDDAIRNEMVGRTPLKRLGEADDIAIAALYLASGASSFVTGKIFEVDGGLEEANLALNIPDVE